MKRNFFTWVLTGGLIAFVMIVAARRLLLTGYHESPPPVRTSGTASKSVIPSRKGLGGDAPLQSMEDGAVALLSLSGEAPTLTKKEEGPKTPTYTEKAAVAEDPEMREYVTRRLEKGYAAFFAKMKFSPEKENALSMILVDRLFAPTVEEIADYDKMAAELLGPAAYAEFAAYRDDLPIKDDVQTAMKMVLREGGQDAAGSLSAVVEAVVRSAPRNDDAIWSDASQRVQQGFRVSETELSAIAAIASKKFEEVLAREARNLSDAEKSRLREWFQRSVQFNVRAYGRANQPGG